MKHYTFADWATQIYLAIVAGLLLFFHGTSVAMWPLLAGVHLLLMGAIHGLAVAAVRRPDFAWLRLIRDLYPIPLFIFFYRETGWLNQMFVSGYLDAWLIRLDQRLFGLQPAVEWMQGFHPIAFSELMYTAYFSYYIMIAGIGIALWSIHRDQFRHYLGVICVCFYCCYLTYAFIPVMGPRIFLTPPDGYSLPPDVQTLLPDLALPALVQKGLMYQLMGFIYATFESPGAAFPSSHVAIAVITAWFSRRYLPRLYRLHLCCVILLCLSTVYCRYHYVVDVVAGLAAAAVLLPAANWLYERYTPLPASNAYPPPCPAPDSAYGAAGS